MGYALSVVSLFYNESGALLDNADFGYSVLMRYHCPLMMGLFILWLVLLWENRGFIEQTGHFALTAVVGIAFTSVVLLGAPWREVAPQLPRMPNWKKKKVVASAAINVVRIVRSFRFDTRSPP